MTFQSCRGGVGRGSRVGGRDLAWWSAKALELIEFDVALQPGIVLCDFVFSFLFPACGCLASYRRVCGGVCAG